MNILRNSISAAAISVFFLSAAFLLPVNVRAEEKPQTTETKAEAPDTQAPEAQEEPDDSIEPGVLVILEQMSDTMDSLKKFSFTADISYDSLLNSGQMVKISGTSEVTIERPNKIFVEYTGDRAHRKAWYNDKLLTLASMDNGYYGELKTPDTIDATLDFLMDDYNFTLPLADIVHTNTYQSFTESALTGIELYDSEIGGKECTHLAFVGESIDWQIWVSVEEPKLPCKVVITYKEKEGSPQYEAEFSDWNTDPQVAETVFTPDLPEDAIKIDFINMKAKRGTE